ncbi:hypothetical protein GGH13_002953 [Coemansia sp. S155-1]|nr:hypothetical protein GGH13_002953 [Coemansia sp. S155-1]
MNIRIFLVFFFLFFSTPSLANVYLTYPYSRQTTPDAHSGAGGWIAWFEGVQAAIGRHFSWNAQPSPRPTPIATPLAESPKRNWAPPPIVSGWFESTQATIKHHFGWNTQPSPRPSPIATPPAESSKGHQAPLPCLRIHYPRVVKKVDTCSSFAPYACYAAGAFAYFAASMFSLTALLIVRGSIVSGSTNTVTRPDGQTTSANADISAHRIAADITGPSLPGTTGQIVGPDRSAGSGYSPCQRSIVVTAPVGATRPIKRHSIAISDLMRATNDTGPQPCRTRRATDGSLPGRRRGITTTSLSIIGNTDSRPPSPSPNFISIADELMPTPRSATSVASRGDGLTAAAEAADLSPRLVAIVEDVGTVALKDECAEAFDFYNSVTLEFDRSQQASPSAFVPVNKSIHSEQDIDSEYGAVKVARESSSSDYSYLTGDASLQSTSSLSSRARLTDNGKRSSARNAFSRIRASITPFQGAPRTSPRRDIESRVEQATTLSVHKVVVEPQSPTNNVLAGASRRRDTLINGLSRLRHSEREVARELQQPLVADDIQRTQVNLTNGIRRIGTLIASSRAELEPLLEEPVDPLAQQESTTPSEYVANQHSPAAAPQPSDYAADGPSNLHHTHSLSVPDKQQGQERKTLAPSTALWRGVPQPPFEEAAESVVDQESTTPSDRSSGSPLKRLGRKVSRLLRPHSSGATTLASSK